MKGKITLRGIFPAFILIFATYSSAFAQGTPPFLNVIDSSGDGTAQPLALVTGGAGSSTQGIQVTSKTSGTGGSLPSTSLQPTGQGGITLLQTGAAASGSTGGQNSPMLSLCAQQWTTNPPPGSGSGSNPQCWNLQVLGGGNSNGNANPQDIIQLTRTTVNTTNNTTFLVPTALNFASGSIDTSGTNHGGQMTIGALPSGDADLSSAYITLVGGFTSNTGSNAKANPLQLFPGWLSSPNAASSAYEGALQIGMIVKGAGSTSNYGQLACYTSAETATTCGSVTAPLLGVYSPLGCQPPFTTCSTGSSAAVVAPPGRASVASKSGDYWPAGTEVCRDPANPSYGIKAASACPLGQALGAASGDDTTLACYPSCTTHSVDLNFSDQGVGSHGSTTQVQLSDGTGAAGNFAKFDSAGNVTDSGVSATANQILNIQGNLTAVSGNGSLQDLLPIRYQQIHLRPPAKKSTFRGAHGIAPEHRP